MTEPAVKPRASIQPARLFGQHDRNAVTDRIGELGGARDQLLFLAIVFKRALGERADEDFEQLGIDAASGAVGCHNGFRVGRADLSTTSPRSNHSHAITATWFRPRSRRGQAPSRLTRPGSRRGS